MDRRLGGGFHQAGTTRMSASSADGVVDQSLAVHGVPNLYAASRSTFVTSGQANSTFMIVAFAVRLADPSGTAASNCHSRPSRPVRPGCQPHEEFMTGLVVMRLPSIVGLVHTAPSGGH